MALTYGFYNSVNGDRKYDARDLSKMFSGIISDGVYPTVGTAMRVTPGTGLRVNVGEGRCVFNNTWSYNDGIGSILIDNPDSNNRIDVIVIEINPTDGVRANTLKVLKGTPSANPQVPAITVSPPVYQYPLANVLVRAGASSFIAEDITNRVGTSDTPWAVLSKSAVLSDFLAGISDFRLVTPKGLKDSGMIPISAPGTEENILVADGSKWNSVGYDSWISEPHAWIPYGTIKTKSVSLTNIVMDGSDGMEGAATLSGDTTDFVIGTCYLPAIVESTGGKEATIITDIGSGFFKATKLEISHTTVNRMLTLIDPSPKVKIAGDLTDRIFSGDRVKFTQDGIVKYFLVVDVTTIIESGDTKTVLTLFRGIGSDYLRTVYLSSSAITLPYFSHDKAPLGFPLSPDKWTYEWGSLSRYSAPANLNWTMFIVASGVKLIRLFIPKGIWKLSGKFSYVSPVNGTASCITYYGLCPYNTGSGAISGEPPNQLKWIASSVNASRPTNGMFVFQEFISLSDDTTFVLAAKVPDTTGMDTPGINYPASQGWRSLVQIESLYL